MIKLLIGGSPCTHWSIAQKNNRETEPEGLGWELFKNYLIAKEKFNPDFFLYENNKSAAQPIKDQISCELDVDLMYINSALVSAQNRQRFYAFNWEVEQPEDRGILLRDVLECGENLSANAKSYALTTRCNGAIPEDTLKRNRHTMVAEPVAVAQRGRYSDTGNRSRKSEGTISQFYEARTDGKTNALTTVSKDNYVAEPVGTTKDGKSYCLSANYANGSGEKIGNYAAHTLTKGCKSMVAEPVRIPEYGVDDKSRPLGAYYSNNCGGFEHRMFSENPNKQQVDMIAEPTEYPYAIPIEWDESGRPIKANSGADGKTYTVYEVLNGIITIKDKQYSIKLADGFYIIRKLTPVECERLQTLPDGYTCAVSDAQRYKGLGNGWTAEVIIHILNGALKDVPRDEEIVVLSMYDGIGTGRYCLDKMGFKNVRYYAYEIDKFAKQVAMSNYPDIIQCGDAFQVREKEWCIPLTEAPKMKGSVMKDEI